jgi:hypothetical protein
MQALFQAVGKGHGGFLHGAKMVESMRHTGIGAFLPVGEKN